MLKIISGIKTSKMKGRKEMKKEFAMIGIGNCGSQITWLMEQRYSNLFDTIYINTSDTDLSMVGEGTIKFKIGDRDEIEGTGANRFKMKNYIREELDVILTREDFKSLIKEKRYVFIVVSTAGGTGSGAGPGLMYVLKNCFPDTHFILVAVLPQIQANEGNQQNTEEFLSELYNDLDDDTVYMIYDNETRSQFSDTECLELVNDGIVEDLRILTCIDNYPTPYDSIDKADMESIIKEPGRLLVTRIKKGLTEKVLEDASIDDIIIKAIKQSCHTETDRNKRVAKWGIISYFTQEVNKLYQSKLEKLCDFVGTPIERFNHNAVNDKGEAHNFLYLVASGLSPINDRSKKIAERIQELRRAKATDESSKYVSNEDHEYNEILARKKEIQKLKREEQIKPKTLFDKFIK